MPAITDEDAFKRNIAANPITLQVSENFKSNHITLLNEPMKDICEAAALRYLKAVNKKLGKSLDFTYALETPNTILNKAKGAVDNGKMRPFLFGGSQQQLSMAVSMNVVHVKVTAITREDSKKKSDGIISEHARKGEEWILESVALQKKMSFAVLGNYDPDSGLADIYHFEAGGLPTEYKLLKKYKNFSAE